MCLAPSLDEFLFCKTFQTCYNAVWWSWTSKAMGSWDYGCFVNDCTTAPMEAVIAERNLVGISSWTTWGNIENKRSQPLDASLSLGTSWLVRGSEAFCLYLVADTRLYTLLCWSVGRSVGRSVTNFVEFRAVIALRPLPNRPRLSFRVSGLVLFISYLHHVIE